MDVSDVHPHKVSTGSWIVAVFGCVAIVAALVYYLQSDYEHAPTDSYVGPAACAKCHEKQAKSWATSRMAKSYDVLRPGVRAREKKAAGLDPTQDYTKDTDCLSCHTTGYGLVGGFVSIEKTPEMAGVTCEACHGAGGVYSDHPITGDEPKLAIKNNGSMPIYPPTARVCRRCHNEDSPFVDITYVFDVQRRVASGTHEHFPLKHAPKKVN